MLRLSKEKLQEDLALGLRLSEIAKKHQVGVTTVWRRIKEYGFESNTRKYNYTGQTFGKLKVIKQKPNSKKGEWLCECECGKQLFVRTDCLLLRDKRGSGCKNCLWKGYGEISGTYWNMIISRQKYYDTKFDITIEFAWNLFLKQDRKCAISGLPLCFVRSYDAGKTKDQTASLDRKNSKLGYMIDNVQWVHKDVNKMKQNFSDKYFLEICNKVSKYNESK